MTRLYKKIKHKALPPGTLRAVAGEASSKIFLIDYNVNDIQEKEVASIEECFPYRNTGSVSWINIDGRNVETIKKINENFGVHTLVLEDILNTGQRPKIEDYGDYLFFVLKMIYFDKDSKELSAEQIGIVLSHHFVISFQEKPGDVFDPIRKRIRDGKGRIRKEGTDYLAYALLDAIVDHYFIILEKIGEAIDGIEEELLSRSQSSHPEDIYRLKKEVIFLRKQIWPLREVLANTQRLESKLIKKTTRVFMRDVYDHSIQVNDTLEAFRDAISSLHDIYLSLMSNRMNEIMKVLTIFAAIFIPLTFIAGIYGMNFQNMPELQWPNGYFIILGIMFALGIGMLLYFKNKKWL